MIWGYPYCRKPPYLLGIIVGMGTTLEIPYQHRESPYEICHDSNGDLRQSYGRRMAPNSLGLEIRISADIHAAIIQPNKNMVATYSKLRACQIQIEEIWVGQTPHPFGFVYTFHFEPPSPLVIGHIARWAIPQAIWVHIGYFPLACLLYRGQTSRMVPTKVLTWSIQNILRSTPNGY